MIKVENKGGKGNPYHAEATGEFSSPGAASGKKTNFSSNAANEIKHSQPLSIQDKKLLEKHGMMEDYIKKIGKDETLKDDNKQNIAQGNDFEQFQNMAKQHKLDFSAFLEGLDDIKKSMFVKFFKFILQGFNFNVFKSGKSKLINPRVMKRREAQPGVNKVGTVPSKISTEQVQNLYQQRGNIDNEMRENEARINEMQQLKEQRAKDFGARKRMYENWWNKNWQKVFSDAQNRQQQLYLQKRNMQNQQKELNKRMLERNKFLQGGSK